MTTNLVIDIDETAWVDLQGALGVADGISLAIEDRGIILNRLMLVDSTTEPTVDTLEAGGRSRITDPNFRSIPDAGEKTWARRVKGSGKISVQSIQP